MSDTTQLTMFLARAKAALTAHERKLFRDLQSQDWHHRTCIQCDAVLPRTPETFMGFTAPEWPGVKVYGVCRSCAQLDDDTLAQGGIAYLERLHGRGVPASRVQ